MDDSVDELGLATTISQLERMATHLLICKGDREPLGVNWYEKFLARHPDYRLKYSKALDQARKDISTPNLTANGSIYTPAQSRSTEFYPVINTTWMRKGSQWGS
jgi:hypothetical protein